MTDLYDHKKQLHNCPDELLATRRATVPALEKILFEPFSVLDHGFIRVVDYMGDDAAVVQAARVSYGKGTRKISEDRGLIRYLMRHRHSTPFEMCEIKLHIKLPIFVARQWIRHRTANVNEYSARYSLLDREFYIPQLQHLAMQSATNNQGRGTVLSVQQGEKVQELLKRDAQQCYDTYACLLNEMSIDPLCKDHPLSPFDEGEEGLARELARMNLNLNYYTQWYWKIDLHNLMHFLSLRADSHAQYEIRVYAETLLDILALWVPFVYEAFKEYRLEGWHLSKKALELVKKIINGEEVQQENSGLSAREWSELIEKIGPLPYKK